MASSQYGVSWWAVFLAVSGGMTLFWDLALHRDEEQGRPLASKDDPVFGPIACFETGVWIARERVKMQGAWLEVSLDAGSEGPSSAQQDAYREFLKDTGLYRQELLRHLGRGSSTFPGMVPLGLFLPQDKEAQASESEGADLIFDLLVDGDETGPFETSIGFRAGVILEGPPESSDMELAEPAALAPDTEKTAPTSDSERVA